MRARTLAIAIGLTLFLPRAALADALPPYLLAQSGSGITPPYSTFYSGQISLSDPSTFVATGTVSHILVHAAGGSTLTGNELFYLQLTGIFNQQLNCRSAVKSVDQLGMSHIAADPNAPLVDFSGFTGNACAVPLPYPAYFTIFHGENNTQATGNTGFMGSNAGIPFTAYAYTFSTTTALATDPTPPPPPGVSYYYGSIDSDSTVHNGNFASYEVIWYPNYPDTGIYATCGAGSGFNNPQNLSELISHSTDPGCQPLITASTTVHIQVDGNGMYASFIGTVGGNNWQDIGPYKSSFGASSVLFLPGIKSSRLYYRDVAGIDHELWEPTFITDIDALALNQDGTTKSKIFTKDIIDKAYGNNPAVSTALSSLSGQDLMVYGDFERFMDSLVASSSIKEWRAYPYDWRYDVFDVVANGALTEQSDGSLKQVYLADVLKQMASTSPTGKVTIVAHSNGGLLAKALAITLGADASKYIDRIVMIGTPQLGTPSTIGALLHGDGVDTALDLVSNQNDVRTAAATMPSTYDLLPSSAYFSRIANPVASFAPGGLSGLYNAAFGRFLDSFSKLAAFVEDTNNLDSQTGDASLLYTPLVLRSDLVQRSVQDHAQLDSWVPPPGITVTSITGWGQETIRGYAYTTASKIVCTGTNTRNPSCGLVQHLEHSPFITQDGDGTVVSPSASGDTASSLYFDSDAYAKQRAIQITHKNITSADPIQKLILNLLSSSSAVVPFLSNSKPTGGINPLTVISAHSPVNIVATDSSGNRSGVVSIPGTDFSFIVQDIPGSSVKVLDDEKYIYVPTNGSYNVSIQGYAPGLTTLDIGPVLDDGSATTTAEFTNIPSTASTTGTFTVVAGIATPPKIDVDGDGVYDLTLPTPNDSLAYTRYIEAAILTYNLDSKTTRQLESKFKNVENLLLKSSKWDDGDDDSQDSRLQDKLAIRISRKLDLIAAYLNKNIATADSKKNPRNAQQGIPGPTVAAILDMMNVLRSLIQ